MREAKKDLSGSAELIKTLPEEALGDFKAFNLGRLAVAGNRAEEAKEFFERVLQRQPPSRLAGWAADAKAALPAARK